MRGRRSNGTNGTNSAGEEWRRGYPLPYKNKELRKKMGSNAKLNVNRFEENLIMKQWLIELSSKLYSTVDYSVLAGLYHYY